MTCEIYKYIIYIIFSCFKNVIVFFNVIVLHSIRCLVLYKKENYWFLVSQFLLIWCVTHQYIYRGVEVPRVHIWAVRLQERHRCVVLFKKKL